MENKIKQLRKGILELVILGTVKDSRHYGYSIVKRIINIQQITLNEGTIYPILSRLNKENLVHSEWVESRQGPPRKYYSLTIKGKETLKALSIEFERLVLLVNQTKSISPKKPKNKTLKNIKIKKEKKNGQ